MLFTSSAQIYKVFSLNTTRNRWLYIVSIVGRLRSLLTSMDNKFALSQSDDLKKISFHIFYNKVITSHSYYLRVQITYTYNIVLYINTSSLVEPSAGTKNTGDHSALAFCYWQTHFSEYSHRVGFSMHGSDYNAGMLKQKIRLTGQDLSKK